MTGYIPTLEQIDELHRKIAPSKAAYELVHTHCVIVATIGCQIVRRQNALFTRRCTLPKDAEVPPTAGVTGGHVPPRLLDEHLVLIGGLLHDIGTYRVFKHDGSDGEPLKFSKKRYILHGLKGYEYLLDEGVDESIAQFCRNHTGVGLTREDVVRQELPLPPADYVPMNLEQEVVCTPTSSIASQCRRSSCRSRRIRPEPSDLAERTNSDGWIWWPSMACRIFRRWRRSMGCG